MIKNSLEFFMENLFGEFPTILYSILQIPYDLKYLYYI